LNCVVITTFGEGVFTLALSYVCAQDLQ